MRTRIALVCTVWGAEFTEFFCRYSLASLLSPAALPRAVANFDFTLLLYTLESDLLYLRQHQNFRKLATLVEIVPIPLETLPSGARRGHWIQWHHALLNADKFSGYILLIPDCLYANDAIEKIARSLATNDTIYYCIPQVCLEPLKPHLDDISKREVDSPTHSYLDLSELEIADLFVKFVNPRYAVALDRPDYFVTHPEYVLRLKSDKIELHELTCHALAVSSRATSIAYTFNSPKPGGSAAFLGLLAVGVEYTLKYFEQYFRWSSFHKQLSRFPTLASWSHNFFEPGATEYTNTQLEIAVSGSDVVAVRRTAVRDVRLRYRRIAMRYYAALYGIYDGPARACRPEVRRAIALAMSLPGFRKAFMADNGPVTVFLPLSSGATQILDLLYAQTDPQLLLKFLSMHIIPGHLMLKIGQAFAFERAAGRPLHRPKLRVIDPALARMRSETVTGRIVSLPTFVTNDLITYAVPLQYGPPSEFVRKLLGAIFEPSSIH